MFCWFSSFINNWLMAGYGLPLPCGVSYGSGTLLLLIVLQPATLFLQREKHLKGISQKCERRTFTSFTVYIAANRKTSKRNKK